MRGHRIPPSKRCDGPAPRSAILTIADPALTVSDRWIAEHYGGVFRAAWMMTGDRDEAVDLTREVFLHVVHHADQFRGDSRPSTWLHGILIRLVAHRRRWYVRTARRIRRYASMQPDHAADEAVLRAREQWQASIWSHVKTLPSAQAEVVLLRYGCGHGIQEIAAIVKRPPDTVKSRLRLAVEKLRCIPAVEQIWEGLDD